MSQMNAYHDLIAKIYNEGVDIKNKRTGEVCRTIVGATLRFDLTKGFPVLTTRKSPVRSGVGELLGFFRGYTNAQDFASMGCKFWFGNANETKSWLDNPFRKGQDDLGDIYSKIWTDKEVFKTLVTSDPMFDAKEKHLTDNGYVLVDSFYSTNVDVFGKYETQYLYKRNINQLEEVVRKILRDPSDRRIIIDGWDQSYEHTQSLPVCHMTYQFIPNSQDNTLSVVMTMRSADVWLGVPNNVVTTSLMLSIVARLTGYTPREVVIVMNNAHLYENSLKACETLLKREHYPDPTLVLSDNIKRITSEEEIVGCFNRIEPEDIVFEGYQYHEAIQVEMVA